MTDRRIAPAVAQPVVDTGHRLCYSSCTNYRTDDKRPSGIFPKGIVGFLLFMLCFIDESGELSNYTPTGSQYFLCTAVLMYDYEPVLALYDLRHQLEHEGYPRQCGFHAKNDPRPMKKRVFDLLARSTIFIHSVALKKSSIYEGLRGDEAFVYRIACRMLFNPYSRII